jgi:hypothetical protein
MVMVFDIEELAADLREKSLAQILNNERNAIVHGVGRSDPMFQARVDAYLRRAGDLSSAAIVVSRYYENMLAYAGVRP